MLLSLRAPWLGLGLAAAGGYLLWRSSRPQVPPPPAPTPDQDERLLRRAAGLLRLPTSPDRVPEVLPGGSGLRCAATGRVFPYRDGVLQLLESEPFLTPAQRMLDTPLTALAYDRLRELSLRLAGVPSFASEVASIQQQLELGAGDTVLDLACGHGVFTVEWAKRVGSEGLVIGLDLSPSMLARAVHLLRSWGLANVLLVRGDALHLPLADGCLRRVNCSGGFHQFPDLAQALRELGRVSTADGRLTASTFATRQDGSAAALEDWLHQQLGLHLVDLAWLESELRSLGFGEFRQSWPGRWFAYASARRGG